MTMDKVPLEALEEAYDSLPDRRSLYAQALAELIEERRAQIGATGTAGEQGTEAPND